MINSLNPLKQIIESEKEYKIQIISLEDIKIFLIYLEALKVEYQMNNSDKRKNIIRVYTKLEHANLEFKKLILYSNERHPSFIQIIFELSRSEKIMFLVKHLPKIKANELKTKKNKKTNILKNVSKKTKVKSNKEYEYVVDMYKKKPLHDLDRLVQKPNVISNEFDYLETLILYSLLRSTKFEDICKNLEAKEYNPFLLKMKINKLVNRKFISVKNGVYKLNISHEMLDEACKKIDMNINIG